MTRFSNLTVRDSGHTVGVAVYDPSAEKVIDLAEFHLHKQAREIADRAGALGYEFDADLTPQTVTLNDEEGFLVLKYRITLNVPLRLVFAD